jgi:isoleucyl-tRNA synthetase
MQEYEHKKVEILTYNGQLERVEKYFDILQQQAGKRILIVGEKTDFENLRQQLYPETQKIPSTSRSTAEQREIIELPTYQLTNDLDKRILAELHKTIKEVDTHLQNYILDEATKSAMDFIDKLTNRRLRRSRRRFRSNGMNEDKHAAYATLYRVLRRYLQILAPFTPFITEYLRLALTPFRKGGSGEATGDFVDTKGGKQQSIHLSTRPIANDHYINETLIDEIATVRKIIKLALFIRAKNKIAVKQPLQKLEIKIN